MIEYDAEFLLLCGMNGEIGMISKIDSYLIDFCKDCLSALKEQDQVIKNNFESSIYKEYYKGFPKGLYVRSITEPILKFMIFSSLSRKHRMFPEDSDCYEGQQLLDLAIYSPLMKGEVTTEYIPDIAIEMKWGGLKSAGDFRQWSVNSVTEDVLKLHKNCLVENQCVMQFIVLQNDSATFDVKELRSQIISKIDKRKFRNKDIKLVFCDYFQTCGYSLEELWKFFIILWRIK